MTGEADSSHGRARAKGKPQRSGGHGGHSGHGGHGSHSGRAHGPRGGGDSGGRAGRGAPAGGGKRKLLPPQYRMAKELVEKSGIPFQEAVKIVLGKKTLNEVIQEMLREEKIKKLMETHGLNRALATNIAMGRTNLDIVLLRRRKNQTLQDHYQQSSLDDSAQKQHKLAIAIHGHKKLIGRILSVTPYTFVFQEEGQTETLEMHKTVVKFTYDPDQYKLLRKHMGLNSQVKNRSLEPILRAKDRHHFKNLALQQSIDNRCEVDVTTLEGDTFRGQVEWFGRWEFCLKFKGGARVTLFRHAIYELTLVA